MSEDRLEKLVDFPSAQLTQIRRRRDDKRRERRNGKRLRCRVRAPASSAAQCLSSVGRPPLSLPLPAARCPLPPSLSVCRSSQRPLRPTYEGNPSEKAKRGDQQPRRPTAAKAEGETSGAAAGMNILRKGASFSDSSAAASRHPHRHHSPPRRFSLQWRRRPSSLRAI